MALNAAGVATVSEAVIAAQITQDYLQSEAVIIPTIMDISSAVGPGEKSVGIPKLSGLAMTDVKQDGTDAAAGSFAVGADTLSLDKFKEVSAWVFETGSAQSKVNMHNAFFDNAPATFGAAMESLVYIALLAGVSTSSPDHLLQMQGTGNVIPTLADIRLASKLLDDQNVPKSDRYMVVTPAIETALLAISDISDASKTGVGSPNVTGQFSRIYGFNLLSSTQVTADTCVAYHRSTMAYAWQKTLETITETHRASARDFVSVRGFFGYKSLDSGVRAVGFNATGS